MVNAIVKEISIRTNAIDENNVAIISNDEIIETIYFGGGTPSLLSHHELEYILNSIYSNYNLASSLEITLEANPDDISLEKLKQWKSVGINRLSIGIQSFQERDLRWMNRAHNAAQALNCISLAREAGFENFSIDLIFGTPHLSDEEWKENVQKVINLNVPHIACYALTVEPETALYKMIQQKKKENINTDLQANQYAVLMQLMREAGYEHYEISNFAKPGFRSRHNSSYWQGKKYIGIGPSAHSFDGNSRMWNKANNVAYIQSIQQNTIPFEQENLTPAQQLNEYLMTSIRTMEGMNLKYIEQQFSLKERMRIERVISQNIENTDFILVDDKMILSDKGKLLADGIAVKLFI